jgi:hypothetical protein
VATWLVLGVLWLVGLTLLGELVSEGFAGLWVFSAVVFGLVVGVWMARAHREPRVVAGYACWWFLLSLAGPLAFVLLLPWLRGVRARSLALACRLPEAAVARHWGTLGGAVALHLAASASWIVACGGLLGALTLPEGAPQPSGLGLVLFLVVPGALWLAALPLVYLRWRGSASSAVQIALPVSGVWWGASALAAFVLLYAA